MISFLNWLERRSEITHNMLITSVAIFVPTILFVILLFVSNLFNLYFGLGSFLSFVLAITVLFLVPFSIYIFKLYREYKKEVQNGKS